MKISEATFNELKETFDKAIQEAFGAGKKSVEQESQMDAIEVGDAVRYLGGDEKYSFLTEGTFYEVLGKAPHPHEDIPVLRIEDNRRSVDGCSLIRPDTVHLFEVVEENPVIELQDGPPNAVTPPIKSPNQQRYETNQRAREFVEDQKLNRDGHMVYVAPTPAGHWCTAEFVVNKEKRTVVALLRWINEDKPILKARGIAKCAPNDVFNTHIGKSIALARALKIDIPQEFLDAVQPDKVVVGVIVEFGLGSRYEIAKVIGENKFGEIDYVFNNLVSKESGIEVGYKNVLTNARIIDDTNAEYGHGE